MFSLFKGYPNKQLFSDILIENLKYGFYVYIWKKIVPVSVIVEFGGLIIFVCVPFHS